VRIVTSTLGMDATMVYKDVSRIEGQLVKAGGRAVDDQFQLKIPKLGSVSGESSVRLETSGMRACSTVTASDETARLNLAEKRVGWMASEIVGQQTQVRNLMTPADGWEMVGELENTAAGDREGGQKRVAAGMSLALREVEYRQQRLNVSAAGLVETDDGRSIDLDLALDLERVEYHEENWKGGVIASRLIDPLVLSFDDGLSVLADNRFSFDLDGDGNIEEICSLKAGSGFLVLDKNGDGAINDGGEMFGPYSGDGYDELILHDLDGNNWIDENDPVFDKLQLWMGGGSGEGSLISLREAGVGALSLAGVGTEFHLKDSSGRLLGQVHRSGLFLTEAGEVRPLAEIDLAVEQERPSLKWQGFSGQVRQALETLQELIIARQRRLNYLVLQVRTANRVPRRGWLLERLVALGDDKSSWR